MSHHPLTHLGAFLFSINPGASVVTVPFPRVYAVFSLRLFRERKGKRRWALRSYTQAGKGGAWRCVSLGSVYVAARVGAVCLLACVIACGLCEVPGGAQLRLALVCGWSAVSRREQTEHHKHSPIHSRTSTPYSSQSPPQPLSHSSIQNSQTKRYTNLHSPTQKND